MRINAAALKAIREEQGHTGRSLGAESGVSQQRVSELEADDITVRPPTAKRLADTLGVPISAITIADEPAEVGS